MYYIVSLHQTTTQSYQHSYILGCIISFLYIKPQPAGLSVHHSTVVLYRFSTSNHNPASNVLFTTGLYYIVSLHQTTTKATIPITFDSCIISFLYIKPQRGCSLYRWLQVVLYRFSTSNHNPDAIRQLAEYVVLYRFSTSNHNSWIISSNQPAVVLYRFSTSNHNSDSFYHYNYMLYYIVSLHQTTTVGTDTEGLIKLYYIVSLHQTTTKNGNNQTRISCIISFLYIKPQPMATNCSSTAVVLYRFSTSNHNQCAFCPCSLCVVLYRFSTSNHN